ncbi:hypothetical protein NQ315_012493 [Exocentrus adspersus]|uniref:Integrase catalytic domain-containing protein n=1 Tax=Exocentrus adspersus TaxID=1586481 RepID=A0AAV8V9F5_9CUCU|nr:hypothetical protein NQ315_012493 [Exocentrus adspersus]
MKEIIEEADHIPKHIQSDNGKEFYNEPFSALMHQYGINHYSTFSTMKCAMVERIAKVNVTNPVTYLLEDMSNHPIKGCFYESELQRSKHPDDPVNAENRRLIEAYRPGGAQLTPEPDEGIVADCPDEQGTTRGFRMIHATIDMYGCIGK